MCMTNQENTTAAVNKAVLSTVVTPGGSTKVAFDYCRKDGKFRPVVGTVAEIKPEYVLLHDASLDGAFRAFRFDRMLSRVEFPL